MTHVVFNHTNRNNKLISLAKYKTECILMNWHARIYNFMLTSDELNWTCRNCLEKHILRLELKCIVDDMNHIISTSSHELKLYWFLIKVCYTNVYANSICEIVSKHTLMRNLRNEGRYLVVVVDKTRFSAN